MRGEWRFYTAGEIVFGRGAVRRTGEVVRGLDAVRACLVTDPGLIAAGLHEPVLAWARADRPFMYIELC